MDVSENSGTPKSSILIGFHYKPSIVGYPYFWKHPYSVHWKTHVDLVGVCENYHIFDFERFNLGKFGTSLLMDALCKKCNQEHDKIWDTLR